MNLRLNGCLCLCVSLSRVHPASRPLTAGKGSSAPRDPGTDKRKRMDGGIYMDASCLFLFPESLIQ